MYYYMYMYYYSTVNRSMSKNGFCLKFALSVHRGFAFRVTLEEYFPYQACKRTGHHNGVSKTQKGITPKRKGKEEEPLEWSSTWEEEAASNGLSTKG